MSDSFYRVMTMPVEQLIAEVCEFLVVTKTHASADAFAACLEQQKDIIMSHLLSPIVTRTEATASLKRLQVSPFEDAACYEITSLMMAKVLAAAQTNTTLGNSGGGKTAMQSCLHFHKLIKTSLWSTLQDENVPFSTNLNEMILFAINYLGLCIPMKQLSSTWSPLLSWRDAAIPSMLSKWMPKARSAYCAN